MEEKKSPKVNLQNRRIIYLEIGLIVALSCAILIFSINKRDAPVLATPQSNAPVYLGPTEIPDPTRQPEPASGEPIRQSIQKSADIIRVVINDIPIANEVDFNEFSEDAIFVDYATNPGGGGNLESGLASQGNGLGDGLFTNPEEIFIKVEIEPLFQGKNAGTFRDWMAQNVKYPEEARRNNIQGRVILQFVIEKDGTLSNIEVMSSSNKALTDAAVKALKSSPKWTPGRQRNKPVRVLFSVPVEFRLT